MTADESPAAVGKRPPSLGRIQSRWEDMIKKKTMEALNGGPDWKVRASDTERDRRKLNTKPKHYNNNKIHYIQLYD